MFECDPGSDLTETNNPTPGREQALGALLTRRGIINEEQLEEALSEKDRSGRRIGDILVGHGWATSADLAHVLAEQYSLAFVEILETPIEP